MFRHGLIRTGISALCILLFALPLLASSETQIALTINDIDSPTFYAQGITVRLAGNDWSVLDIRVAELRVFGKSFRHARLECPHLYFDAAQIHCEHGVLELDQKLPISFSYSSANKRFDLEITPAPNENWSLNGRL